VRKRKVSEVNDSVQKFSMVKVLPGYSLFWVLTSTQNVSICPTHTKKVIARLFLSSEKRNN